MSDVDNTAVAKDAVGKLLLALGINQVVCIDDIYARNFHVDDLLEAQSKLSEAELREIFNRPNDVFSEERDIRRQSFREAWAALDPSQQRAATTKILALKAKKFPNDPDDLVASSALAEIVGVDKLKTMGPSEWAAAKEKIKSDQSIGRTLLLFDQDLGDVGGGNGGMTLATDALTDAAIGDRVMCGLLTHTVTIENQHDKWIELAKPPIDQDKFVVVAKGWLSRDPLGFARMLKQVALTPDCRAMKKRTRELLNEAVADAQAEIDKIHIDDFESMVFRASRREGLWEPDMLFRLYGNFHRTAVRQRAYTDDELRNLAGRLRVVSDIPTKSATSTPPATWKIQRQEMYEEGSYINKLHLPLEVGDIFAKTDGQSEKCYIAIGQPCDLMVRSDGKRSPEATDIVLAEVFSSSEHRPNTVELKHFSETQGKAFYVRFRPTHAIHPCVLDLCIYNEDGVSRLNLDQACPDNLLPAWSKKFEHLKEFGLAILKRYESFGDGKVSDKQTLNSIKADTPKRFPLFTSNSALFKGAMTFDAGKRSLSFNCKRVMRLHRSRALALAIEYSQFLCRPAFDRDLATDD